MHLEVFKVTRSTCSTIFHNWESESWPTMRTLNDDLGEALSVTQTSTIKDICKIKIINEEWNSEPFGQFIVMILFITYWIYYVIIIQFKQIWGFTAVRGIKRLQTGNWKSAKFDHIFRICRYNLLFVSELFRFNFYF